MIIKDCHRTNQTNATKSHFDIQIYDPGLGWGNKNRHQQVEDCKEK